VTPETPEAAELPQDSQASFIRNTAVMSVGTALSRVTGLLRVSAMAFALGVVENRITDAYNIANTTPNIIYELALGGILSSVFVPVFVEWLQIRGRAEAWDAARRVLSITVILLSAIMVLGIFAAPLIVRLYTIGAAPASGAAATRELGTFFLRWFMPQILFYGIGAVATGLLNAHRRFAAPMFAPILNNLVVIATFLTFAFMAGPDRLRPGHVVTTAQQLVLGIGTTLGVAAMTVALWPSVRRLGFRARWRSGWRHEAVSRIAHLAKWAVVYVAVNQIGYLIVLILADAHRGDYSAYVDAFIIFQLPHAIFAVSIFTALLPAMSGRWAAGDREGFRSFLAQGIRATALIVIPAAVGYLVLTDPIVKLLLQHGVAGPASTDRVADVLTCFAIGLFSFSLFQLLLRAFYSMQDTRTPALINIAAVGVNTAANFTYYFAFGLGVQGLALGHATAYTFASIAALVVIRRRLDGIEAKRVLAGIGRTLIAAAATGATAWSVARGLADALGTATFGAQLLQVAVAVVAGMLAFVAAALILRIDEVDVVARQLTARWRR
jgi:putative peptidoglycan lipid II flippase